MKDGDSFLNAVWPTPYSYDRIYESPFYGIATLYTRTLSHRYCRKILVRTGRPSVGGPRPTAPWKILSPNRVGLMSLFVPLNMEN